MKTVLKLKGKKYNFTEGMNGLGLARENGSK